MKKVVISAIVGATIGFVGNVHAKEEYIPNRTESQRLGTELCYGYTSAWSNIYFSLAAADHDKSTKSYYTDKAIFHKRYAYKFWQHMNNKNWESNILSARSLPLLTEKVEDEILTKLEKLNSSKESFLASSDKMDKQVISLCKNIGKNLGIF